MRRKYKSPANKICGKAIILSDPHFFHGNILKYDGRTMFMTPNDLKTYNSFMETGERGPRMSDESIENMNEYILDQINKEVEDPDKDTVIINGDFVFANSDNQAIRNAEYCRSRINCRDVRLVFGNHDEPDLIYQFFTYCYEQALIYCEQQHQYLFFNHMPMCTWHGIRGTAHIYGHVHGLYERHPEKSPIARPQYWLAKDVGVNTNEYKPYTVNLINKKLAAVRENLENLASKNRDEY